LMWDKAATYLQEAGAKAYRRSAHGDAVAFWEKALAAIEHLPVSRGASEAAIDLRMRLRNPLIGLGELERTGEHLREAERSAQALGDQGRLAQVSSLLTNYFLNIGEIEPALVSGQRALALGAALGDV